MAIHLCALMVSYLKKGENKFMSSLSKRSLWGERNAFFAEVKSYGILKFAFSVGSLLKKMEYLILEYNLGLI